MIPSAKTFSHDVRGLPSKSTLLLCDPGVRQVRRVSGCGGRGAHGWEVVRMTMMVDSKGSSKHKL